MLKNRITGILPTVNLYFDYPSYRFYNTVNELYFRYGWDKRNINAYPLPTIDPNNHSVERNEVTPF